MTDLGDNKIKCLGQPRRGSKFVLQPMRGYAHRQVTLWLKGDEPDITVQILSKTFLKLASREFVAMHLYAQGAPGG